MRTCQSACDKYCTWLSSWEKLGRACNEVTVGAVSRLSSNKPEREKPHNGCTIEVKRLLEKHNQTTNPMKGDVLLLWIKGLKRHYTSKDRFNCGNKDGGWTRRQDTIRRLMNASHLCILLIRGKIGFHFMQLLSIVYLNCNKGMCALVYEAEAFYWLSIWMWSVKQQLIKTPFFYLAQKKKENPFNNAHCPSDLMDNTGAYSNAESKFEEASQIFGSSAVPTV